MFNEKQLDKLAKEMNATLFIKVDTEGLKVGIDGYPNSIKAALATLISECAEKLCISEDELINEIKMKNKILDHPEMSFMAEILSNQFSDYLMEMNKKMNEEESI